MPVFPKRRSARHIKKSVRPASAGPHRRVRCVGNEYDPTGKPASRWVLQFWIPVNQIKTRAPSAIPFAWPRPSLQHVFTEFPAPPRYGTHPRPLCMPWNADPKRRVRVHGWPARAPRPTTPHLHTTFSRLGAADFDITFHA